MEAFGRRRHYEEEDTEDGGDKRGIAEDGLGGYGDNDYTDVQSLFTLKDSTVPPGTEQFTKFPEISKKTIEQLKVIGITSLFPIQAN